MALKKETREVAFTWRATEVLSSLELTVLIPINRRLRRSICNSKRPFLRCSSGLLRQKATSRQQQQPFSHCWFFLHLTTAPRSRERRGFSYYYSQLEEGWEASKRRRRRPAFLKQLKDQKFHHYYQPSFTAEHPTYYALLLAAAAFSAAEDRGWRDYSLARRLQIVCELYVMSFYSHA